MVIFIQAKWDAIFFKFPSKVKLEMDSADKREFRNIFFFEIWLNRSSNSQSACHYVHISF